MELTTRPLTTEERSRNEMLVKHYDRLLEDKNICHPRRRFLQRYRKVAQEALNSGTTITIAR